MSDHKAVLREHIKLLDAVVNNPEVQIKSYEKVIENLSYTARMPDNELRQKRLQALHLTEEGMYAILASHQVSEDCEDRDIIEIKHLIKVCDDPAIVGLQQRIFDRQTELANHRKVMGETIINPLKDVTERFSAEYNKTHRFTSWLIPRQWVKSKTLHKLAVSSHSLLKNINRGQSVSSAESTLKLMKSLILRRALKYGDFFSRIKGFFRQTNKLMKDLIARPTLKFGDFFSRLKRVYGRIKDRERSKTYIRLKKGYDIVELSYKVAAYYEEGYRKALDELEGKTSPQSLTGPKAERRKCTLHERQHFF